MARRTEPGSEKLYAASTRIVDAAFRADDSVLTPGAPIWTAANIAELRRRFVENPDESKDKFEEKLRKQLRGASDQVVQLAGEIVYIYLWIVSPTEMGQPRKLQLLADILSSSRKPVAIPADLAAALDHGIVRTGTAYHAARDAQFRFLVLVAFAWKGLDPARRATLLTDPWQFKAFLEDFEVKKGQPMRLAMLHIVFPDEFEPIVSREDKSKIAAYFSEHVTPGETDEAVSAVGDHKFSPLFLRTEWNQVVDAWQLGTWEAYRDVQRLGRRTRLPEARRRVLWTLFEHVPNGLKSCGLMTESAVFQALADAQADRPPAFDAAVVDEAQDISIAQLRFLAALGGARQNALFFSGDLGQRIFQQPFSWKALGVDVRGRSKTLRVNYRTSHQIREQADRLLGQEMIDADGNREDRRQTVSVFNGPPPEIRTLPSEREESEAVGSWLRSLANDGIQAHEIGVFVRSAAQVPRATAAVTTAGLVGRVLDDRVDIRAGSVNVATMHLAKGLEFRAVAVMACDDEVLPLQERIENVGDDGDLQEVYDTERQLLYVACTRARDRLSISAVDPASEFLDDVKG